MNSGNGCHAQEGHRGAASGGAASGGAASGGENARFPVSG